MVRHSNWDESEQLAEQAARRSSQRLRGPYLTGDAAQSHNGNSTSAPPPKAHGGQGRGARQSINSIKTPT